MLAAIHDHISQHWAPTTHSSQIIFVDAQDSESVLDKVLHKEVVQGDSHEQSESGIGGRPISAARGPADSVDETQDAYKVNSAATPVNALRKILSQLYVHDARLRNLALKKATTPLHRGGVFETAVLSAKQIGAQEVFWNLPNSDHSNSNHESSRITPVSRAGERSTLETNFENINQKPYKSASQPRDRRQRSWSDPTASTNDLFGGSGSHARDSQSNFASPGEEAVLARGGALPGSSRRTTHPLATLDDVDVVSLFLEDYLHTNSARDRQPKSNDTVPGSWQQTHTDDNERRACTDLIEIPGLRRVFILVDATRDIASDEYNRSLIFYLVQLAQHSDFSICVATATPTLAGEEEMARSISRSTSHSVLPIMSTENSTDEIRSYISSHLDPDIEERSAIAEKMVGRSGGVALWAEIVCTIVNEAVEGGVSGEVVLGMLDDICPRGNGRLDDLYAWKLGRLDAGSKEQALARAVFQWVVLAPEPLRVNELLVALRLTLLMQAKKKVQEKAWWDTGVSGLETLNVDPPMSLADLRDGVGDEMGLGIAMDSPSLFWTWLQKVSQGLLKLDHAPTDTGHPNEPLGLRRIKPLDESVRLFFLKGRGFQTLLSVPENPREKLPSTERFIDSSYFSLFHACLQYLSMTELDSLRRERKSTNASSDHEPMIEDTSIWRKETEDRRKMTMSSYPFLRYAVDNLMFHLLCPRHFRYFLPQKELLQLFTANRCRMWLRWTYFLGLSVADAVPQAILARAAQGPAKRLLDPVYGARFRLERVLKRVWKTAVELQKSTSHGGQPGPRTLTPKRPIHLRSRSDVSESSMVFTLVGGDDPMKSQWMMPTTTSASPRQRARASSSPATPRSAGVQLPSSSPGVLVGIKELV